MPKIPLTLQQVFNQLAFLAIGKLLGGLRLDVGHLAATIVFSVACDFALTRALEPRSVKSWRPFAAMATAFSASYMVGASAYWVLPLAIAFGLAQKQISKRVLGRHFVNPSNVAAIFAFAAFPNQTYLPFVEWGSDPYGCAIVILLGVLTLSRVGLLRIPLLYLAAFVGLHLLWRSASIADALWQVQSIGFLLYAFFVITDPRALPDSRSGQLLYALWLALLGQVAELWLGPRDSNLFVALLVAELAIPLWRALERHGWQARAAAVNLMLVMLVFALVQRSSLNLARNVRQAPASTAVTPVTAATVAIDAAHSTADASFTEPTNSIYPLSWDRPQTLELPLLPPLVGAYGFVTAVNAISAWPYALAASEVGWATGPYSGVAVGDIDLDGRLDVALAPIGQPLAVFFNRGAHRFAPAPATLFVAGPPSRVENLQLADLDNDRYLDLLVVRSPYFDNGRAEIYRFDPEQRRFVGPVFSYAGGRHVSGGIAVGDFNGDGALDFYISYGIDVFSKANFYWLDVGRDVLFVATGLWQWQERSAQHFSATARSVVGAGMTAALVEFDGRPGLDFLLGNDFWYPSLTLIRQGEAFEQVAPALIENNTVHSMSYFPLDIDNDGYWELWENGVSLTRPFQKRSHANADERGNAPTALALEMARLERFKADRQFACNDLAQAYARQICDYERLISLAIENDNETICADIGPLEPRLRCRREVQYRRDRPAYSTKLFKFDQARFPKEIAVNVLLKRDAGGSFKNSIADNDDASLTGWTWAGLPYDVDNDGDLDLYVTNGFEALSHNRNRLLLNSLQQAGQARLHEVGLSQGVAFAEEGRGAVFADLDGDGAAELLVANYLSPAIYAVNQNGGQAVLVELRCRRGNYYCLGATLSLRAGERQMQRQLYLGGHWNAVLPAQAHFGVPASWQPPFELHVAWPDGATSVIADIRPQRRYIVYQ